MKTITKFSAFVILIAAGCISAGSCHEASSVSRVRPSIDPAQTPYEEPKIAGRLESADITESSGLAASKCQPDVLWTHNDSGDEAFIFAVNTKGGHLGTWRVQNAQNIDWEDVAAYKDTGGTCFLYIGETGNTNKNQRLDHKIYRVKEPIVSPEGKSSNRKSPLQTEAAETLRFEYPDARQDSETLLVNPKTGDIYVLTKSIRDPSRIYRIKSEFGQDTVIKAEKISDLSVPAVPNGLLTGGSVSPDGNRVILSDYSAGYEIVLPAGAKNFDEIWKQTLVVIDLGDRKQGEAVSYAADGMSIFATSEGKNSPVFEMKRRK